MPSIIPERDKRGRFTAGKKPAGEQAPDDSRPPRPDAPESRLAAAASDLRDAVRAVETPDIDPTIAAGKEIAGMASGVKDFVQPAARGLGKIFGKPEEDQKERKRVAWYRRIFGELRGMRSQDKAQHVREMRILGEIEKKPSGAGEGGGGLFAGLGALLGSLLGGGGILGTLVAGIARFGGLLKRIPLIGGMIAGGGLISGVMGGDAKQIGSGAGMIGGMFAGGKAGAALGSLVGPVGTMVGGVVGAAAGAFFGEKAGKVMGEWLGKVDWKAIGDKVVGVFEKVGELLGKQFEFAKKVVTAPARAIGWAARKTNEFVKQQTGIDLGEKAKAAGAAVASGARSIGSAAMDKLGYAFGGAKGARKAALAAEMVNSGITDPREQAMFMAQMDHESGGFRSMEESFRYNPGGLKNAFNGRVKSLDHARELLAAGPQAVAEHVYGGRADLGNTQSGDGYRFRGRGYTQLTGRANYAAAGKALGVDLENNPDLATDPGVAAKIATWYWKNRVGAHGASGNVEAVTRRINGGLNGLADRRDKFGAYQSEVASGALGNMASTANGMIRGVPSVDVPVMRAPSPAPSAAAEQPIRTQKVSVQTNTQKPDVGQDVRDRRIAHVATGGMGA